MTNEEILKKAISKAVMNGYRHDPNFSYKINEIAFTFRHQPFPLIFSHKFAKGFWGEKDMWGTLCDSYERENPNWKYHLQHMVLKEQPLKYLERYL